MIILLLWLASPVVGVVALAIHEPGGGADGGGLMGGTCLFDGWIKHHQSSIINLTLS